MKKDVLGVNLGNTSISTSWQGKHFHSKHRLSIKDNCVFVGDVGQLRDVLSMLGRNIQERQLQEMQKDTSLMLKRSPSGKIDMAGYPLETLIALALKAVMKFIKLHKKEVVGVVGVNNCEPNGCRIALQSALKMANINEHVLASPTFGLAARYMQDGATNQLLGVVDFGDRACNVSYFKLHYYECRIIECLANESVHFGGMHMSRALVHHVVAKLQREKGINILQNKLLMSKLTTLCSEGKRSLGKQGSCFIRINDLSDSLLYGCKITNQEYEQMIQSEIESLMETISETHEKVMKGKKVKYIIGGGASATPLFRRRFQAKGICSQIVEVGDNWAAEGLSCLPKLTMMLACPFQIRMVTDGLNLIIVSKGEDLPVRRRKSFQLPRGEVSHVVRFTQNGAQMGSFTITGAVDPIQVIVEVDRHAIVDFYACSPTGLLPIDKHNSQLTEQQFHNCIKIIEGLSCQIVD